MTAVSTRAAAAMASGVLATEGLAGLQLPQARQPSQRAEKRAGESPGVRAARPLGHLLLHVVVDVEAT